jgi:cell division septum initiation protein DivIVA
MANTSTELKNYNKKIYSLLIWFTAIFSLLFCIQWYSLCNNLEEYKVEKQSQLENLKNVKTNLFDVSKYEKTKKIIILNKENIEEINGNLNRLAEEIYNEKNKAVTLIDKDIDRLNLYMAIGIGFLALFGIFVPLVINFLSYDDLKENQKNINSDLTSINKEVIDLKKLTDKMPEKKVVDDAIEKSNNLLEKTKQIDDIKTKTDDVLPKISTISLQIAINRLFNVSTIAVRKLIKGDNSMYISLFVQIKDELTKCKKDNLHQINSHSSLKQTLKDFSEMLQVEQFRFSTILQKRKLDIQFSNLASNIDTLIISEPDNETKNYDTTIGTLEQIIAILEE